MNEKNSGQMRLPNINPHEELETVSRSRLNQVLPVSNFELRDELQRDKGIDITGELKAGGSYTNYRFIVQLKASAVLKANTDGSYSYALDVANINYLMNAGMPAFYMLYHAQEDRFYYISVVKVYEELKKTHIGTLPFSYTTRFSRHLDEAAAQGIYNEVWEWGNSLSKFNQAANPAIASPVPHRAALPEINGTLSDNAPPTGGALESYLEQISDYEDSWSAFYRPAALIGREPEMQALADFAYTRRAAADSLKNVLWQVIYGDNAVGKTRLAVEWLKKLKTQNWTTGKLDASYQQLERLLTYNPENPTAIVFDNADLMSDRAWLLLEEIGHQWNAFNIQVRILMISHSNLEPRLGYYDRSQKLLNSRYRDGMPIRPIEAPANCLEIMSQTALNHGQAFDDSHASGLMEQTGGRPAFLSLAGIHQYTWQTALGNYAKNLLRKGEILFGPQGLDLVLLSALVGPVTDDIRHQIAPDTGNLVKLTELFSKPPGLVSEFIPRIQPDLLANEIIYEGFTGFYTRVQREKLIGNIFQQVPEASLTRVTDLWRESLNNSTLFDLPLSLLLFYAESPGEHTARAALLESLFNHIAPHFPQATLESGFNSLLKIRSTAFARAFLKDNRVPDKQYNQVLTRALHESMPTFGLGSYLLEYQKYLPCTYENKAVWGLLLDFVIGLYHIRPDTIATKKELAEDMIDKTPKELNRFLTDHLAAEDPLERVFCILKLSDWANRLRLEFEEALDRSGEIVDHLFRLMESRYIPDFISACYTLATITWGPLNQVKPERIGPEAFERAFKFLHAFDYNSQAFYSLLWLIGDCTATHYKFTGMFSWFNGTEEKQGIITIDLPEHVTTLHQELKKILQSDSISKKTASVIALNLLRTGWWDTLLEEPLTDMLLDPGFKRNIKYEILVRVFANERGHDLTFTRKLLALTLPGPDLHYKYIMLAGIYCSGLFGRMEIAEMKLPAHIGSVDVFRLRDEAKINLNEGRLGQEAALLLQLLKDIHIGMSGFTIHKLKAKTTAGEWAYYFILVEPESELAFLKAIAGDGSIDLTDFGYVVASSYGEKPTQLVRDYLKEKYDFDV
ncbi:DUF4365 domain-containing protein [Mucilaginibacter angelicae]|uniref:DUF4365 domain-containing protein n=1 Tax=Mucilaginibacter angelicae TaxID=869718 RepID=A0ABV6L4Y6_9SPHI